MITLTQADVDDLIAFMKINYGIDLTGKKVFIETRLQKQMQQMGFSQYPPFFAHICADVTGEKMAAFISSLTVNYTLFNRESEHFKFLAETVLPQLVKKENAEKSLRVWSAACSTGEEPYTMAMVMSDFFGMDKAQWDTKILATDISTVALKKAEEGTYLVDSIQTLPSAWARHYFRQDAKDPSLVHVRPFLRQEIIFRKHNLVGPSFQFRNKFHFIFCRNVMIYFDEKAKTLLFNRLYDALEDGGYLFIGMSETITKDAPPFKYVKASIYRKELKKK
jgi:Methylase of chemotaxis methyl-accepting proteins